MGMSREHWPCGDDDGAVLVNTAESTTAKVRFEGAAGARVYIPSGSTITELTFYDAPKFTGDFLASYDDAATPVEVKLTGLSAGRSYPVPAKMYGAGAIKMVGNAAGTVYLSRKS